MTKKQIPETFTNHANYSNPDNIGSDHWFKTLIGKVNRIGAYLRYNSESALISGYGEEIEKISMDLINWQKSLNNEKKINPTDE